jgi:hypothetical protein
MTGSDAGPAAHRPRLAAVVSIYHHFAHAQHICDRFLEGYGWGGRHHRPEMDLVSLYVDQVDARDLSRERAARHAQLTIYPTIAEALTLGGRDLAVDGVLLIAEHGDYPYDDKGHKRYPRYEFFRQIVSVFRTTGRAVPVFCDKHLSFDWERAREMVATARELGFPLMAGSSLPLTRRLPPVDLPLGAAVDEAMCVTAAGKDGGDIHALEAIQGMVERRRGGETGVRWLQAYQGEAVWRAHAEGLWSPRLLEACLCRSHQLTPARPGFNHRLPTIDEMRALAADPWAYHYEHNDGLRCTMLILNELVGDFCFAARVQGRPEPLSTQLYLAMPPAHTSLASFFSPQVHHIERMVHTGRPSFPVERTLLTTGLVIAGVDSRARRGERVETPHLDVRYAPNPESTYETV